MRSNKNNTPKHDSSRFHEIRDKLLVAFFFWGTGIITALVVLYFLWV